MTKNMDIKPVVYSKPVITLAIINIANMLGFGVYYMSKLNYEFIIYLSVVLVAFIAVAATYKKVRYPIDILIGLTVWAIMHMAGGAVYIGEYRLYELILIPMSETQPIFRFDQFVHIWGFGTTTLLCYHLLKPSLNINAGGFALWMIVAMAGLGIGAVNEILEYFVTLAVPESGVGDYVNTSLDLIADIIGAILAVIYLHQKCKYNR